MSKKINILSLFAGMGTLELALINQNFEIGKSYASEIKPYAIKLMQHHFPDTIQLGNINNWKNWDIDWKNIDLIGSGSPCQDLSIAGRRAGIYGSRSRLFFVFVEILEYVKKLNPDVLFLQENVASAPKKDIRIISEFLGIYPQLIDSKLWLPQSRKRLFWTNIRYSYQGLFGEKTTDIPLPTKRKEIYAKDIITSGITKQKIFPTLTERYVASNKYEHSEKRDKRLRMKSVPYVIELNKSKESNGKQPFNQNKGNARILNKTELCRIQGFPDNYCDIVSYRQAGSLLGDAWSLPVVEHIISFIDKTKFKTRNLKT